MASFSIQTLLGLNKDTTVDQLSAVNHSAKDDVEIIDVVSVDCEPVTVDIKTVDNGSKKRASRKRPRQEDADSLGNSPEDTPSSPTTSDSDGETSTPQGSPAANNTSTHSSSDESTTSGGGKQKSKRLRTAFTASQLRALEYSFRMCPYPDSYGREQIARTTGIDEAKIQVWFQNRRARYRKREKPLEPPQKTTMTTPTATPLPTSPSINPSLSPAMLQAYYATAAALHHGRYNSSYSTAAPHSPSATMTTTQFLPPSPWYHHMANPYFSFPAAGSSLDGYWHAQNTTATKKFTGDTHRSPQ